MKILTQFGKSLINNTWGQHPLASCRVFPQYAHLETHQATSRPHGVIWTQCSVKTSTVHNGLITCWQHQLH